jgi:hypothetical protein
MVHLHVTDASVIEIMKDYNKIHNRFMFSINVKLLNTKYETEENSVKVMK